MEFRRVLFRSALQPALVVAGIAIFEAVGQQEIDDLVLGRALPVIGGRRGAREGQRDDGCEQAPAGTPAAQGCAMKSSWVGRCAAVREIGRASCRGGGCQSVWISVGAGYI